jgi:hypothetical protein
LSLGTLRMEWRNLYEEIKMLNWLILLILSAVSYFLMSPSWTLGVILGGLLIIANFGVLQHTIRGAFSADGNMIRGKISIVVKYYFRLLALGVMIYLLITRGWVDAVGLAVGLSTVVLSIVIMGIHLALKTRTGEAT